jgi:hypothetical protein
MLAHAFLSVTAAERADPAPTGLIPLTCNEIRHPFTTMVIRPVLTPRTGCTGPDGDVDTKPAPGPATTAAKPPHTHDHDLRLEYQRGFAPAR